MSWVFSVYITKEYFTYFNMCNYEAEKNYILSCWFFEEILFHLNNISMKMTWELAFASVFVICVNIVLFFSANSDTILSNWPDSGKKSDISNENSLMFFSYKHVLFLSQRKFNFRLDRFWWMEVSAQLIKKKNAKIE